MDGSSRKNDLGQTQTGYAVVTQTKVLKAGGLPSHYSAQAAELIALTEACKLMKDKEVTISTVSMRLQQYIHLPNIGKIEAW